MIPQFAVSELLLTVEEVRNEQAAHAEADLLYREIDVLGHVL